MLQHEPKTRSLKKKQKNNNPKGNKGENERAKINEMENKEAADSPEGELFFPEP